MRLSAGTLLNCPGDNIDISIHPFSIGAIEQNPRQVDPKDSENTLSRSMAIHFDACR